MSYFNAVQEAYMEYLNGLLLSERCWCGWALAGKCTSPTCKPNLTCADKCLPCTGYGKRWQDIPGIRRVFDICPDCNGTGMKATQDAGKEQK